MSYNLSKSDIKKIKRIEKKLYPSFMWQYDSAKSEEDIKNSINKKKEKGNFFCYVDDSWYILGIDREKELEISDLASLDKMGFSELNKIFDILKKFGKKRIKADCRDATSYNLIKLLEKRDSIKIIQEKPWMWGNEKMYKVIFEINTKTFKEWLSFS